MRDAMAALFAAFMLVPAPVLAQPSASRTGGSHVGIIAGFGFPSDFNDSFDRLFDADQIDVRSRDFEIGIIIRGRQLHGDWGVQYVQKSYEDGSTISNIGESCYGDQCIPSGSRDVFQDVQLRGVAVYKFAPFVTIKQRAQVGLTFAGGVGRVKGTAEHHQYGADFLPDGFVASESVTQIEAKELFLEGYDMIPIWKLELTGSVLLGTSLKVRGGWGVNFTNYPAASLSVSYLIGSR